jgi:beta-fructofuranosidase
VTKNTDGSIKLEAINDCSGVTFYEGIWHVWHQCCQSHWDHVISKDLVHWQRLPPPIQPVTTRTWDGSISMLAKEDGGPLILYDAEDGKLRAGSGDRPILGVARLADPNDKYLMTWTRVNNNPVVFEGAPGAFPGQVWKNGDHFNFIM